MPVLIFNRRKGMAHVCDLAQIVHWVEFFSTQWTKKTQPVTLFSASGCADYDLVVNPVY
jgi:hypothetical protein